jgi:3-oxoadipate enol-lactonase
MVTGSQLSHTTASDGAALAYRLSGSSPKRVALVHSLAMNHSFWDPVVAVLAEKATVLTWDCRGHGASGKPRGPYTVGQFADDLAAIFTAIGWTKAVVAGASMGGCVSLAFAGRHSGMVAGLGLFDTTAYYGSDAPQQWAERAEKAATGGLQSLVAFQQTRWFGDAFRAANPDILANSTAVFLNNDIAAYVATCHMLGAVDLRDVLPTIAVPTRIVVGEEDYATPPAMAEMLHAGIVHSTYRVIKAGGHLTPLEQPATVAGEISQLMEAVA